jgi:DNA repair photolyase
VFVRWDQQIVTEDAKGRLPGYADAVVRRFDAPEALDTRFHEVRTKSALNHVPRPSRVPFEWTINPYRGCSHACAYCLSGDTRILMAGGRTRPLRDIRPGDVVYGTRREGASRRYVLTEVLDHWSTRKPAHRITLEDGTELVASGDHRFLTTRGWKHVAPVAGEDRLRPHLTLRSELVGAGAWGDVEDELAGVRGSGAAVATAALAVAAPAAGVGRARSLEGRVLGREERLRVVAIEPLEGERTLYDITTGTGDFIAEGVVSHNCFARPTHEFLDLDAGRDFEKEIIVKVNLPEVLRAELARPSWKGGHVALGTNTDPYQWVEGRYKLMRGIWAAMRDFANPCSILTKSPLLLRDLDLLKEIAAVTHVSACLSVPTLEEKAWRATEPHTPHPRARLEAVAELNRQGIPTGILIAPLMPGINDAPEQVERIVELATEAGAVHIGGQTLFLRGAVRDVFFDWLHAHRPDLVPRYERLYARGAYVPREEARSIERAAGAPWARERYPQRFKHRQGQRYDRRYDPRAPGAQGGASPARPGAVAEEAQARLF